MGKYRVDCTLSRLAAIAISKELWKHSYLRNILTDCFKEDENPRDILPTYVSDVAEDFAIPEPAKEELTFVVGMMGQQIVMFYYGLDRAYFGLSDITPNHPVFKSGSSAWMYHIHWTDDGCVDFPESIRSLYISNMLPENIGTWLELCTYCLEDCISDFWHKQLRSNRSRDWCCQMPLRIDLDFDMTLVAYWTTRVDNNLDGTMNIELDALPEEFCDEAFSLAENMFIYAFVNRNDFVAKYFWGLLDEDQRKRVIAKICEKIGSDDPSAQKFKDLFFSKEGPNVYFLQFFLRQLSFYGHGEIRMKILGSGFILRELLDWPYDNSFLETLKESWTHHDSIDYGPIITSLLGMVSYSNSAQYLERDFRYRKIFHEIWKINPKNLKNSIEYSNVLRGLFQAEEIEILKLILGDEELAGRRRKFLTEIIETHNPLKISDRFLKKFIREVLDSKEEREWFGDEMDKY